MDVNLRPKWQCPSCKKWVKEPLHKKCKECRQFIAADEPYIFALSEKNAKQT